MKYPLILKRKCKTCDGEIIAKRSRDLNKEFCSPSCVGKFFKTKEKEYTNCLTCNKKFEKTCRTQNMYCSTTCYHRSQKITHLRSCKKCGKEFRLKNISYEKRGGGKFCSRECGAQFYSWDESYFEKINTEQKAYWLGFIYADGCVSEKEFRLHLSKKDIKHLKKFAKHLKSNHPIHYCQQNTISFNIGNKKIIKDLQDLGVIPRKTFIVQYPNLPKHLNRHFIRGVFDGDGCLYTRKDGIKTWSIYTASVKFKNELIDIIKKETGITVSAYKQYNGYHIKIFRQNDVQKIKNYMYENASIFLKRKKNEF